MEAYAPQLLKIVGIVWINIVLSGDNAVVIALACRGLPPERRRLGLVLGAGVAIVMRLVFTLIIVQLLATPFLKVVGGLMLLGVAVRLILEDDDDHDAVPATNRLWRAVWTIAVADAVMSLDNVLAIAAVAGDSTFLLVLGLAISIPLIVAGASLIMRLLERFPVLVWAGAALLGWVAGDMLTSDPYLVGRFGEAAMERLDLPADVAGALLVLALGYGARRLKRRRSAA